MNSVPTCANSFLTQTVLRGSWGFRGFVTSDTGAVEDIYQQHNYTRTAAEAACAAIYNGTTDLCSGTVYLEHLMPAVAGGLCPREAVTAALSRTLTARFSLGLFDPVDDQPYWNVPLKAIGTPAAAALNYEAALQSMVLLKNLLLDPPPPHTPGKLSTKRNGILPLDAGSRVVVIGPHANATDALLGSYLGQICPDDSTRCVQSLFEAITISNVGGVTLMAEGCKLDGDDTSGFAAAVDLARGADVVVLAMGLGESLEGESHDRKSLELPKIQASLAAAVLALGRPAVLVILAGAAVDVTPLYPDVGAVLYAGYPGFHGARAISESLFGGNPRLGGKLATTWYTAAYANAINVTEMELDVGVGRGYRYYNGSVQWPFGYGLSLTNFDFAGIVVPSGAGGGPAVLHTESVPSTVLPFVVNVTNSGNLAGDEVVQLYAAPQLPLPSQPNSRLLRQLVGYQRVHLEPGAWASVAFNVTSATLRLVDHQTGDIVSSPGTWSLIATNGVAASVTAMVVVEGTEIVVEPFPGRA